MRSTSSSLRFRAPMVQPLIASCALVGLLACSGSDPGLGASSGAFSEACEGSGDCAEGLVCGVGGPLVGLCTKTCDADSECQLEFGDQAECHRGVCVQGCSADSPECPPSAVCNTVARFCTRPPSNRRWECGEVRPGICDGCSWAQIQARVN